MKVEVLSQMLKMEMREEKMLSQIMNRTVNLMKVKVFRQVT